MSWGFQKAGKGSEILEAYDANAKGYSEPQTQKFLAAIRTLVAEMVADHDEHVITVETSGHVDKHAGSGSVSIRIWPK